MIRRVIAAVAGVLTVAHLAAAQNARIDAMGGIGVVITDIVNIIGWPAYVIDNPDVIQATYDGAVDPLIGVKDVNGSMSLGILYQQNRTLYDEPYTFLINNLVTQVTGLAAAQMDEAFVYPIPHALLGLDLGGAKLGIDVYVERAFYSSSLKSITGTTETTTSVKGRFIHPGAIASLHLDALRIQLGGGAPIARHTYEQETAAGTAEEKARSRAAFNATAGVELDLEMSDLNWTFGLGATAVNFSGEYEDRPVGGPSTTTEFEKYTRIHPRLYGGFDTELGDDVLAGLVVDAGYIIDRFSPQDPTAAAPVELYDTLVVTIGAGFEKPFENLNRLDALYMRGGLTYAALAAVDREHGESGGDETHLRIRYATARSGFGLPLGIGIMKSLFTLDVQMNPGVLINTFKLANGQFATNDFVKASLTVNFGGGGDMSRKSSPVFDSAPPASPAPAEQAPETPPPSEFEF